MPDYSFLGLIAQFWQLIYAEKKRLEVSLGHEAFELQGVDRNTLAEFVPAPSDVLTLNFFNADHTKIVLVVEAEHLIEEAVLDITNFPQRSALEDGNQFGYGLWAEFIAALLATGLLIDHRAQILAATQKSLLPPKPAPGSSLNIWFDWFESARKYDRELTLKLLAKEVYLSESHVRRAHANYARLKQNPRSYKRRYKKDTSM